MAAPKSTGEFKTERKKATRWVLVVSSVLGHVGLLVGLGEIEVPVLHAATAIEVFETPQEKPKPPPPAKVEPSPPQERPEPRATKNQKPAPAPAEAPPEAAPPQSAALSDLPDLGLELGNGGPGGGGFAVAQAPRGSTPAPTKSVARSLGPETTAKPKVDPCTEEAGKPKPLTTPQPSYSDAARAAGVEGKVRVQLVVDENGAVVEARVLAGLGHGLDEAALSAAKSWTFQPAVRCGRPSRSTFTVAMRFTAS